MMMQRWNDLTPEEQQRYLTAEELRAQLTAVTAERDDYRARHRDLEHELQVYQQGVTAAQGNLEAQLALVDRYGADQWRRGNAGKEPQEFSEWQREQPRE